MNDVETHPKYWDCECENDYIHEKGVQDYCSICRVIVMSNLTAESMS